MVSREFSRKAFLKGSGALVVGFSLAGRASADTINISPAGPTGLDSWIVVHGDNTVTVLAGKVEYGQGTTTGLRQIAAEELGVSFDQIRWVRPETGVTPNQGATVGSGSISRGGPQIRAAAAYAAQTLLGLASTQLGVPASSLSVENGLVSGGGKSVKYGDLQHAGRVALAELALAEDDGRGVVGMHRDPGIDQVRIGRAADVRAHDVRDRQAGEAEADDEGAAAFDDIAARENQI